MTPYAQMKRKFQCVGFAVYLDLLERLSDEEENYDVDALVLYDETADAKALKEALGTLTEQNIRVSAQKKLPQNLRYRSLYRFGKGGLESIE